MMASAELEHVVRTGKGVSRSAIPNCCNGGPVFAATVGLIWTLMNYEGFKWARAIGGEANMRGANAQVRHFFISRGSEEVSLFSHFQFLETR
jgi:hypothetical protein